MRHEPRLWMRRQSVLRRMGGAPGRHRHVEFAIVHWRRRQRRDLLDGCGLPNGFEMLRKLGACTNSHDLHARSDWRRVPVGPLAETPILVAGADFAVLLQRRKSSPICRTTRDTIASRSPDIGAGSIPEVAPVVGYSGPSRNPSAWYPTMEPTAVSVPFVDRSRGSGDV